MARTGGGRPGEKGAGGVREAGEEGAGSGIPKVAGSGRKREKLCNIAQYFAIEKIVKGREPKNTGREPGLKSYGKREVQTPPSPPPHIHDLVNLDKLSNYRTELQRIWLNIADGYPTDTFVFGRKKKKTFIDVCLKFS